MTAQQTANTGQVVFVGRTTPYGNPVRMNRICPVCGQRHTLAGDALNCFRRYLFYRLDTENPQNYNEAMAIIGRSGVQLPGQDRGPQDFAQDLLDLRGKVLVCPGCGANAPNCHARKLEDAIKWLEK